MKPISTGQIQKMHALARDADMDEDELHALVDGVCGKSSIRKLTSYEGIRVINRLLQLTGQEPQEPEGRATSAQCGKIKALARELGWEDPERLRGFLKARFQVESVNWLPANKAWAVIEALKAMKEGCRGERKRGMK